MKAIIPILFILTIAISGCTSNVDVSTEVNVPLEDIQELIPDTLPETPAIIANDTNETEAPAEPVQYDTEIKDFAFEETITIPAGSTITWTNADETAHSIKSDTDLFNSFLLGKDQAFNYTFNDPGTYTYHCNQHPYMTGTVVVN